MGPRGPFRAQMRPLKSALPAVPLWAFGRRAFPPKSRPGSILPAAQAHPVPYPTPRSGHLAGETSDERAKRKRLSRARRDGQSPSDGRFRLALWSRPGREVFGRNVARAVSEAAGAGGTGERSRKQSGARSRASDGKPTMREALFFPAPEKSNGFEFPSPKPLG